tara:strand:- start:277 stop:396 length:120 start_codon:yes stop_codon:yes gene_type:complete
MLPLLVRADLMLLEYKLNKMDKTGNGLATTLKEIADKKK